MRPSVRSIALSLLLLCSPAAAQEVEPAAGATYGADAAHTGYHPGGLGTAKRRKHPVLLLPTVGWDRSYLQCFDGENGKRLWVLERDNTAFHTPPTIQGGVAYGCQNHGKVYAVAIDTGKLLWEIKTRGAHNSQPVIAGGRVFVTDGRDDDDGEPASLLVALNAKTGKTLWEQPIGAGERASWRTPTVVAGIVYMPSDTGLLFSFEAATGKLVRKSALATRLGPVTVAGARLYAVVDGGELIAVDRKTLKVAWKTGKLVKGGLDPDAFLRPPAVAGEVVVVALPKRLVAVSAATGKLRWSLARSEETTTPVVAGGLVYQITEDTLLALDLQTGASVWKQTVASVGLEDDRRVAVAGGVVYSLTTSETRDPKLGERALLVARDGKTGKQRWSVVPALGCATTRSNLALAD